MNLRAQIRRDLEKTIDNLPSFAKASPGEQLTIDKRQIEVTRTSSGRFGDYSTNVALKITSSVILEGSGDSRRPIGSKTSSKRDSIASLASLRGRSGLQNDKGYRIIKQSPIEIARILADSLKNLLYIEKLEVAPPGFINFFIKPEIWQEQVEIVLKAGSGFGSSSLGKGKKARVEFVSANPTGPLHFGNARGGPIGDVLANVLQFCGYDVLREYYHNDIGEQVRKLGESIVNVSNGQRVEEQEYKGEYVRELAKKIFAGPVSRFLPASARSKLKSKGDQQNNVELRAVGNPPTTATPKNLTAAGSKSENEPGLQRNSKPGSGDVDAADAGKKAVQILFKEIMADCAAMGIEFDKFYSESELANTVNGLHQMINF
ncbi:arginine--tRNA ligase [Candidatus Curtissbacteria bacterium]|nr:arginine--tRNA ligase [Candidatus Curtissbacteria bacterium]